MKNSGLIPKFRTMNKTFIWNNKRLEKVVSHILARHDDEYELLMVDTLLFNANGFPKSNSVTICQEDSIMRFRTFYNY